MAARARAQRQTSRPQGSSARYFERRERSFCAHLRVDTYPGPVQRPSENQPRPSPVFYRPRSVPSHATDSTSSGRPHLQRRYAFWSGSRSARLGARRVNTASGSTEQDQPRSSRRSRVSSWAPQTRRIPLNRPVPSSACSRAAHPFTAMMRAFHVAILGRGQHLQVCQAAWRKTPSSLSQRTDQLVQVGHQLGLRRQNLLHIRPAPPHSVRPLYGLVAPLQAPERRHQVRQAADRPCPARFQRHQPARFSGRKNKLFPLRRVTPNRPRDVDLPFTAGRAAQRPLALSFQS